MTVNRHAERTRNPLEIVGVARHDEVRAREGAGHDHCVNDIARTGTCADHTGGARLLSRKSVEMLGAVHVPDTLPGRPAGEGYGLSVRVVTGAAWNSTRA